MKLSMIVCNNELQIKFEFRCYWSILSELWALGLSDTYEVKIAAGGILVPFRGRHLVFFAEIAHAELKFGIQMYHRNM
jgi:hypothetical protein